MAADRSTPRATLAVLCVANFLILLDTTIVNTAVPSIMGALRTGLDTALWILNGYLLAFAALLIVFGRLGDALGPRRLFLAGLAAFTTASALCGLAGTPAELIAARVLQGMGAAVLIPQALVLISVVFPPERRGAAFGIFTAVAGIAAVSGPTLGGFLLEHAGWRWIFFLNVPIGVLGVAATPFLVPEPRIGRTHRLDPVGVLVSTGGMLALVFGLVEGSRLGWAHYPLLAGAVALLAAFAAWERGQAEPLVPPALLGAGAFGLAALLALLASFAMYGFLLVYVLETQSALGMTPLRSGVWALALTVTLSAVAPVAGRAVDRVGARALLCTGFALNAAGTALTSVLPTTASTGAVFVAPLILIGAGMGLTIAPTTTEAMRAVSPEQAGAASGVLNTARQLGSVLGATIVGAVLQNRLDASLTGSNRTAPATLLEAARPALVLVATLLVLGAFTAARLTCPGEPQESPIAL